MPEEVEAEAKEGSNSREAGVNRTFRVAVDIVGPLP